MPPKHLKKTLLALFALAGVAGAADYTMTKGGNLYAGEFTLTFTLEENFAVTGDYDILAAYYQTNGSSSNVNSLLLNNDGTLTLNRGGSLSSTTLTNDVTISSVSATTSTFVSEGTTPYVLGAGSYTLKYLGGDNGAAAADLYLGDVKVAGFTGGSHNMNGAAQGGDNLTLQTNDSYSVVATSYPGMPAPSVPEPTTATLSLLALAGLAARRRRR